MRDPARIDRMIERLRLLWKLNPDQRLGQLVVNLVRICVRHRDRARSISDHAVGLLAPRLRTPSAGQGGVRMRPELARRILATAGTASPDPADRLYGHLYLVVEKVALTRPAWWQWASWLAFGMAAEAIFTLRPAQDKAD